MCCSETALYKLLSVHYPYDITHGFSEESRTVRSELEFSAQVPWIIWRLRRVSKKTVCIQPRIALTARGRMPLLRARRSGPSSQTSPASRVRCGQLVELSSSREWAGGNYWNVWKVSDFLCLLMENCYAAICEPYETALICLLSCKSLRCDIFNWPTRR